MSNTDNNVQSIGKFRYIEPNDVLEHEMYPKRAEGARSYNITHPYEDYSIDVELEVKIPRRGIWTNSFHDTTNSSANSKVGTESFFGGTNGFLTDTPGSMIYKDILNNQADRESLGITHIHIAYNSYFVPEITINFTDIRGMGLFMTHEEAYRLNRQTQGTVGVEKFFAALFTFPYPEFTLKVKGFYGKKVSYSLVVSDFKSSFNNQTGNFDATVKFIGKMYGVYTDIPMTYLLIAPYCKYGVGENETVWSTCNFKWENGHPMPTLIQLKRLILGANARLSSINSGAFLDSHQSIFIKKQLLHEVSTAYNNFTQHMTTFTNIISDGQKIFLCPGEGTRYNTTFSYLYPETGSTRGILINLTQTLYDKISAYNATVTENDKLPFIVPLANRGAKIDNRNAFVHVKINQGQIDGDLQFDNDYDISFQLSNYNSIKSQLQRLSNGNHSFFVVNSEDFITKLIQLEEDNNAALNNAKSQIISKINEYYEDELGFAPTIKNIFMLVLAHLQAFLTVFQKCINNINTDTNRTIQSNNLNSSLLPDIPLWVTGDSHLPPFPALKNNATNTFVYPTEINNANLEEDNFINHLFAGASDTIAENETTDANGDNTADSQNLFIPTCITDFHCYGNAHPNPYYYTFMDNDNAQTLDWIFTFFGYRCAQKFLLEHSQNPGVTDDTALYHNGFRAGDILLTAEEFGQYEAFNFWLAHPVLSQNIYNALNNNSDINADNFVKFIANDFTFDGVTSAPTTWEDKFIAEQNSSYLQVFNLNNNTGYPARLCHGEQYNTQYTSDKTNFGYSFLGGRHDMQTWWSAAMTIVGHSDDIDNELYSDNNESIVSMSENNLRYETKPYLLIKPIEISQLNQWQQALNTFNHNAITCDKHKNIIQQYIDNNYHPWFYKFTNVNDQAYFHNYSRNPAYNVLFQTNTVGKFFERHSDDNHFYKQYLTDNGNLHPCNYITNHHDSNVMVYSMHGRLGDAVIERPTSGDYVTVTRTNNHQIPLFFMPNMTAGDFLCNIPHNIEGLARILRDGRRIVKMPYVTKLFIGYIIDAIRNKDFAEMQKVVLKILDQAKATSTDNYHINDDYLYGNVLQNHYISAIYIILSYLTCDENKNFNGLSDSWNPESTVGNDVYTAISTSIKDCIPGFRPFITFYIIAKSGLFSQDIFRFADEYRLWRDNNSDSFKLISDGNGSTIHIPGFIWLKNNMCLKENEDLKLTIGDVEIELTETTPFGRLIELLKNGQIRNWLSTLNTRERSLTEIATSDENPLNRYYKHYDNSEESQSTSAFGDIYCSIQFTETYNGDVNLQFNPEWRGTQLLNNLLKHVSYLIYPYSRNPKYFNQNLKASKTLFTSAFNSFKDTLKSLCTSDNPEANVTVSNVNSIIPLEQKLSMYRTLKNLYDKHFTNINSEINKYHIMKDDKINEDGEMGKFHFIDTYYEDLGDKLIINPDTLIDLINTAMDTYGNGGDEISSDLSLYSFLSLICQKHNMLLMSMPIFNGSIQGDEGSSNFAKMFKPLPKKDCEELEGPSYICFYPHQASQHLDIPISQYRNDGFLITDVNNTQNFEGPTTITGLKESGKYTIPAFGVEYGTQKQSIFTNINVNMDNPQVTEASVAVQFGIANEQNTNTRRKTTDGQDLFKIYSNYSYTCQVEMMGCAQVQPLMYFQLNNIPMFRGAYQIINVEHDITPGNMTTSFKGVRINKTNIPMTSQLLTFNLEDIANAFQEQLNTQVYPVITLRDFDVTHMDALNSAHTRDYASSSVSLYSLTGDFSDVKSYVKFEDGEANFNELNPSLRQLVYCILQDIKDINDQNILDYTLGINITSTVRRSNDSTSHSDHEIADGTNRCSPKPERENIRGEAIRVSDGAPDGVKKYSQMGCAIDFCATRNGSKDKGEPSILLYYHILKTYYPYIKQLIWEVDTGLSRQENISHIIHLASYGKATSDMKCQVFMAENFGQTTIRGRENWSRNFTNVWDSIPANDLIENLSENQTAIA